MGSTSGGRYGRERQLLTLVYFAFYFIVFGGMILQQRLLSQVRPVIFNFNRDLTELAVIATGLPRWMTAHPGSFLVFDVLLFALPVLWLVARRRWLGWVFVGFLALYLLLADIFWQVHHEPFILYVLLPLAFITPRFYAVLKACRYYFLYIFISAAVWKIARGAAFNGEEMSRILLVHHSELLSGDCAGWLCRGYTWLIEHPLAAQCLYWGDILLEAAFVIGLFTRRYDRLLLGLAVLFVVADLLVMRIPYWILLLGGVTLWLDTRPRKRAIVVYETTHHENLPALLDCCEMRFPRVVVFLKEVSYRNITGSGDPAARWLKTRFIIQRERESNRRFITRLFRYLREHRCSHLHLATQDNNLLLWALRLTAAPEVQVSLTVHEVNAFFTRPFNGPRNWTETLAKPLLRRRIRHFHFFLPAMAERFKSLMPQAVTVFLPSRFYDSSAPYPAPNTRSTPGDARPFAIVIPGSVDPNRRDYDTVLQALDSWSGPPLQLVLLGDSSGDFGRTLVAKLRSLAELRAHQGYIPETTYEQEIRDSDVLWSPLRIHKTGARDNPETYGRTTASGLTADILLNNIPALVPDELVLPGPFRPALLPYSSPEEAKQHLLRLATDSEYRHGLRRAIHESFTWFSKANFIAAFDTLTALGEKGEKRRHDPIKPVHPNA